jgi:hypothetical protein
MNFISAFITEKNKLFNIMDKFLLRNMSRDYVTCHVIM